MPKTIGPRSPTPRTARGPVRGSERALAPDLARGAMLLFIALANSAGAFFASAPGIEPTPHGLERVYNVFMLTSVHARAFPMFAVMFGYGLVQLARRQAGATGSPTVARRVLLRRNTWLFVFGALHAILLYAGDFLGAYGLVGLAFTLVLLRRSDRVHRIAPWYLAFCAVYALALGIAVIVTNGPGRAEVSTSAEDAFRSPDYLSSLLARLSEWPVHTLTLIGGLFCVVWIGVWAARRRLLEEPGRHLRLLRSAALGGTMLSVAGGLPMGLHSAGVLNVNAAAASWVRSLYEVTGTFGGVGYVALFGLLAHTLSRRTTQPRSNLVVEAVTALGQRSLSGYLLQSVVWAVLAWPFALSLGTTATGPTFVAAGCALGVWLFSLVGAVIMQRRSYRGPAEVLLRRLTYGRHTG